MRKKWKESCLQWTQNWWYYWNSYTTNNCFCINQHGLIFHMNEAGHFFLSYALLNALRMLFVCAVECIHSTLHICNKKKYFFLFESRVLFYLHLFRFFVYFDWLANSFFFLFWSYSLISSGCNINYNALNPNAIANSMRITNDRTTTQSKVRMAGSIK